MSPAAGSMDTEGTPLSGRSSLRGLKIGGRAIFFGGSPGSGTRTNEMRTLRLQSSGGRLRAQWSFEDEPLSGPKPAGAAGFYICCYILTEEHVDASGPYVQEYQMVSHAQLPS